jgi:hypothetical protein
MCTILKFPIAAELTEFQGNPIVLFPGCRKKSFYSSSGTVTLG